MKNKFRTASYVVITFLLVVFSLNIQCNKKPSDNNGGEVTIGGRTFEVPEKMKYDVKLKDNATTIEAEDMQDFISSDTSGDMIFKSSASSVAKLKPGQVSLFYGRSIRKITGVEKNGNQIIVHTDYARMTDYFQDADIQWEQSFKPEDLQKTAMMKFPFMNAAYAQTEHSYTFNINMDEWEINLSFTPKPTENKMEIDLKAKKNTLCNIEVKGWISYFTTTGQIRIENGAAQDFNLTPNGMEGELELIFGAVSLGEDVSILELPFDLLTVPVIVGGIPVNIDLKANLKVFPVVPQGVSSIGHFKVHYHSNNGFTVTANGMEVTGGDNPEPDMEITPQETNTASATLPAAGIGMGIEFPRLEVSICRVPVVPYIVLNTTGRTFLDLGFYSGHPCQEGSSQMKLTAGVNADFLGFVNYSASNDLWQHERTWRSANSHCEDETPPQ